MRITVLGTRGIPSILGGVETHCEHLYPRIVEEGHRVTIITRKPYVADSSITTYKGIKLKHLYAPKLKSVEAITHTLLGVFYAAIKRPDILHIHAVGPMILTPVARLFGLKVVVTNHGPDYDRQKWGKLAKAMLKMGERLGTRFANQVIVISNVIKSILKEKYHRNDCNLIYNGVIIPQITTRTNYISSLGLEPDNYIIAVGRFVEEKGFHDLIDAYIRSNIQQKLVLVGDADHETKYSQSLKEKSIANNIVLTGFIKGAELNEVFSHAKLFVMPSYHEGLPIALLEALSYNLNVLVSDIPANLEVNLPNENYFKTGDVEELSSKLRSKLNDNLIKRDYSQLLQAKYNWDIIAKDVIRVYEKVL
ncbi:glycosyl transferase family 1 [Hanstruepera neustonica]|uniref:Glycosyl transferase family 1 n=1 Tax=Hanstruepera neustonica TaxID=1445657 RepID=A0A2K1E3A3_9FLAO|nr:glycosyltransferase family 4 protein [Hanstruepera neustonica]PNQ74774.1 glycosyl transferase family 1 [Hanstruepera neustonica]